MKSPLLLTSILTCLAATVCFVSAHAAPKSIVGQWAPTPDACGSPMAGATLIEPMGITQDEMSCTFKSVARNGNTVTWTGSCSNGDRPHKVKVVATEVNGRLSLSFNGRPPTETLVRCPK